MGTAADSVGLTKPAGEVLVEVAEAVYAEVVHPQAFGVGAGPGDPGIFYAPGKVKVSAQRLLTQAGSGEAAPGALERDRALGDGVSERAARLRQLDEPVIQRDDLGWLTEQVALDGPLLVHLAQATCVSAEPVTVYTVAGLAAGSGVSVPSDQCHSARAWPVRRDATS